MDAARESCMEEECERVEAEIAKERVHNENRMLKVLIKLDRPFLPCPKSKPLILIVLRNSIALWYYVTDSSFRNDFGQSQIGNI